MPYKGKLVALVQLTPSQVLEDQRFLQSEIERRVLEKGNTMSEKSEQRESGVESETPRVEKQERSKHSSNGVERKESKKKSFLLRQRGIEKAYLSGEPMILLFTRRLLFLLTHEVRNCLVLLFLFCRNLRT